MPHSKNEDQNHDRILKDLQEKVRLVEKSGQKNTVHHHNLERFLVFLNGEKKSKKKENKSDADEQNILPDSDQEIIKDGIE